MIESSPPEIAAWYVTISILVLSHRVGREPREAEDVQRKYDGRHDAESALDENSLEQKCASLCQNELFLMRFQEVPGSTLMPAICFLLLIGLVTMHA